MRELVGPEKPPDRVQIVTRQLRTLVEGTSADQASRIGDQTGGRVFLFLHTQDFWEDYNHMREYGVRFIEEPREEPYGLVVVFLDLYGNKWDLVQRVTA